MKVQNVTIKMYYFELNKCGYKRRRCDGTNPTTEQRWRNRRNNSHDFY